MSGTIAGGGNNNLQVVFRNCATLTNRISEINNTKVDNAKDIDSIMPMYNLLEYSDKIFLVIVLPLNLNK